jgi:hypothetical protein
MAYLTTPFTYATVDVTDQNGSAKHSIADISELHSLLHTPDQKYYYITFARNGYEFNSEYTSLSEMVVSVSKQDDGGGLKSFLAVVAKFTYLKSSGAFKVKKLAIILTAEDVLLTPAEISAQLEGTLAELRTVRLIAPCVSNGSVKQTCRIIGSPQSAETAAGKKQFAAYKAAATAQIAAFNMLSQL